MVNKADLITAIQEAYTNNAGITDRSEVENALIFDADSLINTIYGSSVSDDEATGTYTTSNANFDYDITFVKVGTLILLSGRFSANNTLPAGQKIFDITDAKLLQASGSRYDVASAKPNSTDALPILLLNNDLLTNGTVFSGEGFRFEITYKSEN